MLTKQQQKVTDFFYANDSVRTLAALQDGFNFQQ